MGSQQSKPNEETAKKQQQQKIVTKQNDQKHNDKNTAAPTKQKDKDNGQSQIANNRKSPQNNKVNNFEQAGRRRSKQNSSLSNKNKHISYNNNSQHNQKQQEQEDDNQFMPLLKLGQKGKYRLKVMLLQMVSEQDKNRQPYLSRSSAQYNAKLEYSKSSNNCYQFSIEQDGNYSVNLEADLQGNLILPDGKQPSNATNDLWMTVCPANIPFGNVHRIGQFQCVNLYQVLQFPNEQYDDPENDTDHIETRGPSLKNLQLQIDEQVYYKWGQKPPRRNPQKPQSRGGGNRNKLPQYKQISRYFSLQNNWVGSTFVEQTSKYFRGWAITVIGDFPQKQVNKIGIQIVKDIKTRQLTYIQQVYARSQAKGKAKTQHIL